MRAIVTSVRLERDTDVAHVRRTARLAAKSAGAAPRDQIRFATAVSEIARNALQYAGGGIAELSFDQKGRIPRLVARIQDRGPGIAGVDAILRGRHQSHTGLGLGLNGSQKLVDNFDLKTGEGGTVVTLGLHLAAVGTPQELAHSAASALVDVAQGNPVEELAEQNRALRDSLAEQEFLLRELHHRTKNNLSIIQSLATLQARSVKSEEAREALDVLTGRIQAFANAHSYLYKAENVAEIDLREHVLGLTERLSAAFRSQSVEIVCDVESMLIGFDFATELALIINELVTNAAKHAFKSPGEGGHIHLDAHRSDHGLTIRVRDDGPGLADAEAELRRSKSLGWRIVETSARKLRATLEVDGSDGLAVTVHVPLQQVEE
ncbi:sensor histidine kinase [Lutibaculum baratangense]|uniref:histidine kinase n=1 Tax=Lutibaculum baratangense AMV1 TaxID=631454 RepID=V4TAS0_9HYPH|nr:ATP-binding protein [Lutibaculum baratangense]ESR23528.1 putative signal transduction histidine kinase [Lutibaculum baratangense AMV1]